VGEKYGVFLKKENIKVYQSRSIKIYIYIYIYIYICT